jgi:hypothetical protein
MSKLTISIVADDEVRIITDSGEAQKLFSENPNSDPILNWTPKWTREIISYLVTSEYMQSRYRDYINYLIYVGFRKPEYPEHAKLVFALKLLLGRWMTDCAADGTCLAPPSRRMLQDSEMKKVLSSYMKMSKAIEIAKSSENLTDTKAALNDIHTSNDTSLQNLTFAALAA